MKRLTAWILLLALGLTACGREPEPAETTAPEMITVAAVEITVPTEPPTEAPTEPEPKEVPLLAQQDYPVDYGGTTVPVGGCGITSVAMMLSYYLDEDFSPAELAETYGRFGSHQGSDWKLFPAVAEDFNLICTQTFKEKDVLEALEQGKLVICNQYKSIFTSGGHFIVLTGLTEEGNIRVNDPNRENWEDPKLAEGFANGFSPKQVFPGSIGYWIFELPG